jgi:ubiquinone/menaquinone biosynthesis C-methylase UbiE
VSGFENWIGRRASSTESNKILFSRLADLFESYPCSGPALALEVGCGEGDFSASLWQLLSKRHPGAGTRLYTLDINLTSTITALRNFQSVGADGVRALRGDFYNLPLIGQQFDYFFAFNVFYWAKKDRLLREARRVLKENGKIFTYDRVPAPVNGLSPVFFFTLDRSQLPQHE